MCKLKKLDCPFCGEKKVVSEQSSHVIVSPGHTANTYDDPVLGDYTQGFKGGGFDYSHANNCLDLDEVIDKEGLLRSYLNHTIAMHTDFFEYRDYQKILRTIGVSIHKKNAPSIKIFGNSWGIQLLLVYNSLPIQSVKPVIANTTEEAFNILRHRLLCGQIIQIGKKRWQLVSSTASQLPVLKKISNAQ